jgi:NADH dehydrogenase
MFGPDDAFLTTILKLLSRLPFFPMFGRDRTRLQPAYVEDVAEAVARVMRRAEIHSIIFEFGGPRVYSYEQFLRAVAHQAGLAPHLIPIPFAVWHALARAPEILPGLLLTRNQVELMQIDRVVARDVWIFRTLDFAALGRGPAPGDVIKLRMKEDPRLVRFNG